MGGLISKASTKGRSHRCSGDHIVVPACPVGNTFKINGVAEVLAGCSGLGKGGSNRSFEGSDDKLKIIV